MKQEYMTHDMKKTLTRLFTVALLMMVSMGARAEIKIDLGGKDNNGVYEGGTVTAKQSEAKDGKVTVTLIFTPDKNYSITRKDVLLAYTAPTNTSGNTRADNPTLGETFNPSGSDDVFAYPKSATYTVTVDANLGLSVQKVEFLPMGRKAVDTNNLFYIRANADNDFYLCPAIGCYYLNNVDQPHLTTFKTSGDQNSIWIKEPVENETDTYYIIHFKTGRYLKSNEDFTTDNGSKHNRKAVHLEVKPETLTDDFKFLIKDNSGSYQIYPKVYWTNASTMSFNPTSGHKECYAPADGGVQGMIGLYGSSDAGSKWKINSVPSESIPCATPIIKYDGDNINISYPYTDETGITIYYTTDGTQPTTSSSSSSSTSFNIPSSGVVKVRAIATKTGLLNSDEAVLWGSARPFLIQSKECEDYYLVPSGNGNNVTTSSLPGTSMQWTLQNAGASTGGVQYYYVVNSNSKKINYNSDKTLTLNDASADANKFCIVENGYNTGNFFLIPVSDDLSRCLFKIKGNADPDVSKAETLKDWGSQSGRDQWTLKACNVGADQKDLFSAPPFSVSDADEAHYYLIQSFGNSGYYIIPPSATDGYVQTSNSSSDYSDVPWVFKKAGEDNWLTYYYIINAATGQFMHFNLNDKLTGEGTNVVSMKDISEKNTVNEDKFQYVMVPSTTTGAYYIVPKGYSYADDSHINFKDNKYYGLWENSGNALKTTWSRSSTGNHVKWTFSEKTPLSFYIDPDITQDENGYVTISHLINACDFYYTNDGTTTPVVPADGSDPVAPTYKYSGPFLPPLGASKIIAKAAIKGDHSITSNPVELEFSALAQPTITFDNATSTVTITSLSGATIYYAYGSTDPADPTVDEGVTHGDSPVTFTVNEKTFIKAIAVKGGFTPSAVQSATIDKVAAPVTDTTSDGKVKLTSTTPSVTIYYEIGDDESSVATPTTSSTRYTGPLQNVSGKVIKAIAVKDGWITSDVGGSNGIITLQCAMPVIRRGTGNTFTISSSFPAEGVSIYYTTDSGDPTKLYEGPVSILNYPITVKAIATADHYSNSSLAEVTIIEDLVQDGDYYLISSAGDFEKFVSKASTADGAGYKYKVTDDFTYSSIFEITQPFTGTFEGTAKEDGAFCVISGLRRPLFTTTSGAVIKNIILQDVQISESGNVGAIAGEAGGYTRIYNCGILPSSNKFENETSDIKSTTTSGENTGYCGGLVGWLKDDSRVINCFSYANITGGATVGGIVGYNNFASTAEVSGEKYPKLRTAVVNCMFYGDISGGSNRYPVYGGAKIVNNTTTGINNYDFYRAEASVGTLTDYNCSWPAMEEFLTHYEFYRNLLNSNRELCGWWVGATSAPSTMTTTAVQAVSKDASLIAKWVIDTSVAPYPILKKFGKYASAVNIDADASWRISANEWEGKNLGTLKVTIDPGDHAANGVTTTSPTDFIITDMDTLRSDYCYRKIQLPYYNTVFGNPDGDTWAAKYGGNYGDYVVIGWKISTSEGTEGEFSEDWKTGYNFADRNCTAKDVNRVFAQGGYYYVPNGVGNITITAQWASAIYLDNTDRYYDRVSVSTFGNDGVGSSNVSPFAPAGTRPETLGNGKTVQNGSISSKIPSGGRVYENAIVLVGNHQFFTGGKDVKGSADSDGCSIMSADFNCDDEPDYCLEWQLGTKTTRQNICPIRFDFLPITELGLSLKEDGSKQYYSLGCYHPLGHFEVTETALIHFGQFEFSSVRDVSPIILNGGIFDQYTKGTTGGQNADKDKITYIILGGNVKIPSFTPGSHVNSSYTYSTRHCAVNVMGGNIDYLYLTGNYNENVKPYQDDPHCYIDGGRFKQVAAAGKEGINGDVYFKINHSKIWEFYGGSTMDQSTGDNYKVVKGNIDVTIDNSMVDKYCGGPKFGDMNYDENNFDNGKTVTTNANNTTFGVYYGGGNGGTSYVQYNKTDGEQTVSDNFNWAGTGGLNNYTPENYRDEATGYMADYDMEIVNTSAGTNRNKAVYRSYFFAAQFSATNTGSITNNLTDCTVLTNFYGGGNLGGVKGNVTSILDGTTRVYGSVFGAGFSAAAPEVTIHNKDKNPPAIDVNTGIIKPQSGGTSATYTWTDESNLGGQTLNTSNNKTVTVNGVTYLYTTKSLKNLGAVSGAVILTIKGNTIVEGKVFNKDGTVDNTKTGGVYGGGDASAVINDINPAKASTTVNLQGNAQVYGNVFGGGNNGEVSGSATVNIQE